ncbi:MAG: hypothetical protein EOQ55_12575 [Mesorhizobium sp.]|uniref:ABC transporter C-terminal domain-containing protein n=1 Tax=Mesorhizobium sp. TaxID=1871066 RepID=UPI000FE6368C|nr:ABC transporter C-terminal domain-containing protein [Mesorhizobium sp.]RWG20125.1 MAG: hypothetical protein EOQ55_12575 [Mesorhizobium sp.]RWI96178.1 MAG: hypothetical protein EOR21_09165 [Mesorhizobium sp.]
MAATVGSISIDLSTNASRFAEGFKKSAVTVEQQSARMAKAVDGFQAKAVAMGATLKNFGTGLVAGAGIAALGSFTGIIEGAKKAISDFDEIAANSRTVGLRTDAYQALGLAAQQANISNEDLTNGLKIFAKNAGLAEQGTGALYGGLKKLNPELLRNILATSDQEERLKAVADALKNAKSATEQAAIAAAVFGKGGVDLVRVFDGGRQSIDAFIATAKDMGIIIPDELLQKAGELDDKLDVLSKVTSVNLSEALVKAAPLLVKIAEGLAEFAKEASQAASGVETFMQNKSVSNFFRLIGGDASNPDLLANRVADAFDHMGDATHRSAEAINADIAAVEQQIAELQQMSDRGIGVGIQIDDAKANLQRLQDELKATQAVGVSAANAIRAGFAQAFRAAENASMDALAQMQKQAGNAVNVIRYGAPANSVIPGSTYQNDVNGTGVAVRSFGVTAPASGAGSFQSDANGSGVDVTRYTSDTADNTEETAHNVERLDQNTHGYFRDLGDTVTSGAATISHSVSTLADLIGNEFGQLPSYLIAALQTQGGGLNTGNISKPSTMFGDQWSPEYGSHVGDVLVGTRGHYQLSPTSSDGSYDTQVSVAQPGSDITLNYYAAPGESTETAKQRARDMYNELTLQAARA